MKVYISARLLMIESNLLTKKKVASLLFEYPFVILLRKSIEFGFI